jgi:hypothetical protein
MGAAPLAVQAQGANNKAAAEALFEEGRKLVTAGKAAEGCPKFAESQRLDPSPGTLLNLANCYETTGKTASAWVTFKEAASAAQAAGRTEYVATAQKRATALSPKLSRLTITTAAEVNVTRDGLAVEKPQIGVAIPVDPGAHVIEASAAGKKPWRTQVQVGADAATVTVTVPALEDAPVEKPVASAAPPPPPPTAASASPPPPPPPPASNGQRIAGYVVGGVGVVGLGLGVVFTMSAKSKYNDSVGNCAATDKNLCNSTGVAQRNDARSAGNIATIATGLGAAAVIGGVVLVLTAPKPSESQATLELAPTLGGAVLRGAW